MNDDETDARIRLQRSFEDALRKLDRIEAQVHENGKMTTRIHSDLYGVQNGADGRSLIERMRDGLRTIDRVSWLARIATWLSFAGSLAVVAIRMVWEWIIKP